VLPAFGNPYELTEIEERLSLAPDDVSLLFSRACLLDSLGRNNEARDAYIEVIKRDGTHIDALGNLGALLYNAGYRSAARLTYIGLKRTSHCRPMVPSTVRQFSRCGAT
jgi:Flp pilus assembly protein TadD